MDRCIKSRLIELQQDREVPLETYLPIVDRLEFDQSITAGACNGESRGIFESIPIGYLRVQCAEYTRFKVTSGTALVSTWVQP